MLVLGTEDEHGRTTRTRHNHTEQSTLPTSSKKLFFNQTLLSPAGLLHLSECVPLTCPSTVTKWKKLHHHTTNLTAKEPTELAANW